LALRLFLVSYGAEVFYGGNHQQGGGVGGATAAAHHFQHWP